MATNREAGHTGLKAKAVGLKGRPDISIRPAAVYPAFDGPERAAQAHRGERAVGPVEGGDLETWSLVWMSGDLAKSSGAAEKID